jgi:hypothetical protein
MTGSQPDLSRARCAARVPGAIVQRSSRIRMLALCAHGARERLAARP